METFSLTLSNGATLGGRYHIPSPLPASASAVRNSRALVVALHGGSFSSQYFDVDSNHTASIASDALSIPFVAINRPGYEGSTSFPPFPEGSSFVEQYGEWLHELILPALWAKYGVPNNCTCIVLLAHSLGTGGAVIAAAKSAQQSADTRKYPLGGVIMSGWGSQLAGEPRDESELASVAKRDELFLPPGTADPSIYEHTERLVRPLAPAEMTQFPAWASKWRTEWAAKVTVPVMLGVAERDALWKGSLEHLQDWMAAFPNSVRVDGSFLRGAPHNIEMSLWSRGWYARCFGFAHECAITHSAGGN